MIKGIGRRVPCLWVWRRMGLFLDAAIPAQYDLMRREDVMKIELTDDERVKVEAAYFRVELFRREMDNLFVKMSGAENELKAILRKILGEKANFDLDQVEVRPQFENFRLICLEINSQEEPREPA